MAFSTGWTTSILRVEKALWFFLDKFSYWYWWWCNLKGALSGLRQFLATESPFEMIKFLATESLLKMIKMLFISPQKLFPFSRYLSFRLDFLAMYRSGLIKKIMLISSFMTSQHGEKIIAIHILPNILRSKGNHWNLFSL